MASKKAPMSDRARQVLMDMKRKEKEATKLEHDTTFDGVASVLRIMLIIVMIAGTLYNYGPEIGNFLAGNPSTASAASKDSK